MRGDIADLVDALSDARAMLRSMRESYIAGKALQANVNEFLRVEQSIETVYHAMLGKAERIFVIGPYSAPTREERQFNVDRAMAVATRLALRGHWPYVPHLSHYWDEFVNEQCNGTMPSGIPYGWWMALDEVWLKRCTAVYYIDSSPGADRELAVAQSRGLKVYRTIDQVPVCEESLQWQRERGYAIAVYNREAMAEGG